jgi:hypothetical protein
MSNLEPSPVFLRELRKEVVPGKKKKAIAASRSKATSASHLERQSGVGSENFDILRVSEGTHEQKES